jgi:5'-nucleotidase
LEKQYGETVYSDPIDVAQHYSNFLKNEQKCDLVICLSHIGYDYKDEPNKISDKILAAKTENIDIILGGHTTLSYRNHRLLPTEQAKVFW